MNPNYAILKLGQLLELKSFEHEDEWKTAMAEYAARNIQFIALKYHHGAQTWQQPEVIA